jgi:hypothetical protein
MRKFLSGFAVAAVACGGGSKKATTARPLAGGGNEDLGIPKVDEKLCDAGGKRVSLFDLDQDGKPDVWKILAEKTERGAKSEKLVCKQVDLNHDGKKDYAAQYDDAGNIILEEYDFDFDGKFDARVHFDRKSGKKYAAERVSGFGDRPDVWEKYGEDERIEALRRDRNGDGRPDYWEQYLGGSLDKILYDDNFDGKPDRKEEAHPERDVAAPAAPAEAAVPAPAVEEPATETKSEEKPAGKE